MIYLGADHGGYELKEKVKGWLTEWGMEFEDMGNYKIEPADDYPDFAAQVAGSLQHEDDRGILVCRTGHGMYIAANRYPDVRAILAVSESSIKRAREDEDVNVLAIAADFISLEEAKVLIKTFLEAPFTGKERHLRRIEKITHLTNGRN